VNAAERWRLSLHEAAHAAVWVALNGWDTRAAARVCNRGGYAEPPRGLVYADYVTGTAAAKYGEGLASKYNPPETPPPPPPSPEKNTAAELRAYEGAEATYEAVRRGPDDAALVASYCVLSDPTSPDDWKLTYEHVHREAAALVALHAERIVEIARKLYLTGSFTYEGRADHNEHFETGTKTTEPRSDK
jgi:hypothetical protein